MVTTPRRRRRRIMCPFLRCSARESESHNYKRPDPFPLKTTYNRKTGAPKVDLMGKIAAAGSAIKNAKLPSPGELKEGYLNSAFHKSLHQPLMVKAKVEKTDVQKARQALTQVC